MDSTRPQHSSDWPPRRLSEYLGSRSFLSKLREMRDRLQAKFPRWAEDSVFDALAHIIASGLKKERSESAFFSRFDSEKAFLAYVSRASENRAKDYAKKHKREVTTVQNAIDVVNTSHQAGPLDKLLADEDIRLMEAATRALTPEEQDLINLWVSGMSLREIAMCQDKPTSTISVRLRRIVAKLAAHVKASTQ